MADTTDTPRPPLSPTEQVAFERLVMDDYSAASALCFFTHADADKPERAAARERALAALARARAADAAANEGRGNFYSARYAAWEESQVRSQVAA